MALLGKDSGNLLQELIVLKELGISDDGQLQKARKEQVHAASTHELPMSSPPQLGYDPTVNVDNR